jgi:hypothetical protein
MFRKKLIIKIIKAQKANKIGLIQLVSREERLLLEPMILLNPLKYIAL